MYIRTRGRSGAKHFFQQAGSKALILALLGVTAASAASAQNGKPHSRSADAVLHIQVHVVPTVMVPTVMAPQAQKNISEGLVTYNITPSQPSIETIETTTLLPRSFVGSSSAGSGPVLLHTLTIVVK